VPAAPLDYASVDEARLVATVINVGTITTVHLAIRQPRCGAGVSR
jgi:hypothetical protein